jgi:extradiol dioxygenase family protein
MTGLYAGVVKPIFHISFPVRNLVESVRFYSEVLEATVGRNTEAFTDIFLFGAQVTLQNDPASVPDPMPRARHFGATVEWSKFELLASRLNSAVRIVEPPTTSYVGQPNEQIKLMIADPSGNLIELKAYRNPEIVLKGIKFE